jgi:ATP-binding cassette subfamily F protein uup
VPLLDHVDLVIEPGERIGLIGRNGTGKSSLLKVIAGDAAPDDGTVWRAPQLKLASVAQEPQFAAAHSVFDAVAEGLGDMSRLLSEYHAATHALTEEGADQDALLHKMHDLQEALDARDGWRLQNRVDSVLTRLKLPSDKPVADLSGGMKKRVALARALVMEPDLLVLDEPTNHLDVDSIEWLEEVLVAFPGSVLFVTHDRRFLDDVAMHIIELDRGRLSRYPGNFTVYQQRKAEALEAEATQDKKFDKFLAQEEVWIRKGVAPAMKAACCALKRCVWSAPRGVSGRARWNLRSVPASDQDNWWPNWRRSARPGTARMARIGWCAISPAASSVATRSV